MSEFRKKPTAIVLDVLRAGRADQCTARFLVRAGHVFGIPENSIRVTLSRLCSRGLAYSPERGVYRLTQQSDAIKGYVERWRLGEARVVPWQPGHWLIAHCEGRPGRNQWVLQALGYRELRGGFFVRPDNLALSGGALQQLARDLGMKDDVLLCQGQVAARDSASWSGAWRINALRQAYADACERLAQSSARLRGMEQNQARRECFNLGGEVIHMLAKDPLLPQAWLPSAARQALWQAMIDYDALGKSIWAALDEVDVRKMPRPHLQAV